MDKFIHTNFVRLQLEESFALLAQLCQPAVNQWLRQEGLWCETLSFIGKIGIENSLSSFLDLQRSVAEWTKRFRKEFYFLPRASPAEDSELPSDILLLKYFSAFFRDGLSFSYLTGRIAEQVRQVELSIPSSKFNERWPTLMSLHFIELFGIPQQLCFDECNLCNQQTSWQVKCLTCTTQILCYNCFRKTAWMYQHDEERVFPSLHSVWCPFCRSSMDESQVVALVSPTNPTPKRQRSNEFCPTDAQVSLSE